jgi:hypothetical protein
VRLGSSVQIHSEAGDRWLHCRPSLFDLDDASLQLRHHLKYQEVRFPLHNWLGRARPLTVSCG